MKIELLYFDGCPSWKTVLTTLREQIGDGAPITLVRIETHEDAEQKQFVGSPTIRVDGADLFPMQYSEYNLGCRVYMTPDGLRGWPTAEMLREALVRRGVLEEA